MVAMVSLVGQRFGAWTVLRRSAEHRKGRGVLWWCRCECGEERSVAGGNLRNGQSTNCGCRRESSRYVIDLKDRTFGLWTVLHKGPVGVRGDSALWHCRCECGEQRLVSSSNLRTGGSLGCGCKRDWRHVTIPPGDDREYQWRYDNYRGSALRRGYAFALTLAEFVALVQQDCRYCGAAPAMKVRAVRSRTDTRAMNGIDRVDNAVGYVLSNCVPCCTWCNEMKRHRSQVDFLAHVRQIAAHNAS